MLEERRRQWNQRQKNLQSMILDSGQFHQAIELLLDQHAMVHSAKVALPELWSFEDELFACTPEEILRNVPKSSGYSIAWRIWHMARIEDMTMNILVANDREVFAESDWLSQMNTTARDSGNAMNPNSVAALSSTINIEELRESRLTVGRKTREIIQSLQPGDMAKNVAPDRLQRILDEGSVVPEAQGLINYWSKRTIAGLMLMPATRHNLVHLNESFRIIQ